MSPPVARRWTRPQIHRLNQWIIVAVLAGCLGGYLYQPSGPIAIIADILVRTYLMFICTVMAHEGTHGHLGSTRDQNNWWARAILIGAMVPYFNLRKTHRMHHARTNETDDPDLFMRPNHWWEIPLRAVSIPHYWLVWLKARGWITKQDWIEVALTYVVLFAVYIPLGLYVGPVRFLIGCVPSLVLVNLLLWYPFAIRTHEGWHRGDAEARSHNYYGYAAFWFSLGLSMHRTHHQHPRLAWIELLDHVERAPSGLPFQRDIRSPVAETAQPAEVELRPAARAA